MNDRNSLRTHGGNPFPAGKNGLRMEDRKRFEDRMNRAAEAGSRYLSSVEKAIRRLSDKSSIESRSSLRDAKYDAEASLAMLEDVIFAKASVEECICLCDNYQCLLMDANLEAPDDRAIRGTLKESVYHADQSMMRLKAAVDGYRVLEEKDEQL